MDTATKSILDNVRGQDVNARYEAFLRIMKITDERVDWAYEVWEEWLLKLRDKNNHVRAIAAQLLCNLAKSDPKNRMLKDFDAVMAVTRDEMFVTARHTLQAAWKVGAVGAKQRALVMDRFAAWFKACTTHKNCTLIRYDICAGLRALFDATQDAGVKAGALALIETETDLKYRKKYATAWKNA